jgi:hypothetical protein
LRKSARQSARQSARWHLLRRALSAVRSQSARLPCAIRRALHIFCRSVVMLADARASGRKRLTRPRPNQKWRMRSCRRDGMACMGTRACMNHTYLTNMAAEPKIQGCGRHAYQLQSCLPLVSPRTRSSAYCTFDWLWPSGCC